MPVQRSALLSVALLAALGAGSAAAIEPIEELEPPQVLDPRSTAGDAARENVWSHGVPEERRRAAEALFHAGNKLMRESITISAAAKYREALTRWDHPNIHFNLAVALMTLDQPVETYEHLQHATKYGPAPLQQERFEHAKNYLTLLEKQLARVQIRCAAPGATVELDGRALFTAPGQHEGLVRAGRHTLVARKEGFVTNQSHPVLDGGRTALVDLDLKTMEQLTEHRRRWPAWIPWTLLGTGVAAAAGGGALHYTSSQTFSSIDEEARERCFPPNVCTSEPSDLARKRERAERMQKIAAGAYGAGGAAVAVGAVLAYLNRGEAHVRSYDPGARSAPQPQAQLEVSPYLADGATGLSVAVRF